MVKHGWNLPTISTRKAKGMTKIAIAVDGEWAYPIYRHNGKYHIDFGGAVGLSDPLTFDSDVKAIRYLQKHVASSGWEG